MRVLVCVLLGLALCAAYPVTLQTLPLYYAENELAFEAMRTTIERAPMSPWWGGEEEVLPEHDEVDMPRFEQVGAEDRPANAGNGNGRGNGNGNAQTTDAGASQQTANAGQAQATQQAQAQQQGNGNNGRGNGNGNGNGRRDKRPQYRQYPSDFKLVARSRKDSLPIYICSWTPSFKLTEVTDPVTYKTRKEALVNLLSQCGRNGAPSKVKPLRSGVFGHYRADCIQKVLTDFRDVVKVGAAHLMKAAGVQQPSLCYGLSWGLDRIDQRNLPFDQRFAFDAASYTPSGVKIFVVDSGVNAKHQEFCGNVPLNGESPGCQSRVDPSCSANYAPDDPSRACFLGDVPGYFDAAGHGTEVASLAAGRRVGVAKNTPVCSIRVLDSTGVAVTTDIIAGLNYIEKLITDDVALRGSPSFRAIVSMSLGGEASQEQDDELRKLITPRPAEGYPGAVGVAAAGNEAQNACNCSPARVQEILTVGSTDNSDTIASFSNFGSCVDVFAPGQFIPSAKSNALEPGQTAFSLASGTSISTPLVSGLAAVIWEKNPTMTPSQVIARVISDATTGVVKGNLQGSPNRMVYLRPDTTLPAVSQSRPVNDVCTSASPVSLGSNVRVSVGGTNAYATDSETAFGCWLSGKSVWHSFTAPASDTYTVSTCGSSFDTVLSVHSGCNFNVDSSMCNDDNGGVCLSSDDTFTSSVTFTATAGQTFQFRVAGIKSQATDVAANGAYFLNVVRGAPFSATNPSGTRLCPAVAADVNPDKVCTNTCQDALTITSNSVTITDTVVGAKPTTFPDTATGSCFPTYQGLAGDMWYKVVVASPGRFTQLNLCESKFNTFLTLHSRCPDGTNDYAIACSEDSDDCGAGSKFSSLNNLGTTFAAGTTLYIRVAGAVTPAASGLASEAFVALGQYQLKLQFTGSFQGATSTSCAPLSPPTNGLAGTCATATANGNSCSFACNTGYSLVGGARTCSNGVLTGSAQTCAPKSCSALPATSLPVGATPGSCGSTIAHGSSCSITCSAGYSLVGSARTCSLGTLQGAAQTCVPASCPAMTGSVIDGSLGTCASIQQNGGTCSFTCNSGTTLTGAAPQCSLGQWQGTLQRCVGNPCPALSAPQFGSAGSCGARVSHGGSCSFTCQSGYTLTGPTSRTCSYGAWQGTAQTCTVANVITAAPQPTTAPTTTTTTTTTTTRPPTTTTLAPTTGGGGEACSGNQFDYRGTVAVTKSGYTCQRWDVQSPQQHTFTLDRFPVSLGPHNYCRNPGNSWTKAWCFTTNPNVRWEECAVSCGTETCTGNQADYKGVASLTVSGRTCQRWDTQTPNAHPDITPEKYPAANLNSNYCRNPGGMRPAAWCYTTDPTTPWEYCGVPCGNGVFAALGETCSKASQTDYRGRVSTTRGGLTCQAWSASTPWNHQFKPAIYPNAGLEANYCRSPDGDANGAWCFTTSTTKQWDYCSVPCGKTPKTVETCSNSTQSDYRGAVAVTVNGRTCQNWASSSYGKQYSATQLAALGLDSNFCRNPNGEAQAWCFTTDPAVPWEYCGVSCPNSCSQADQSDYRGTIAVTRTGVPCQAWNGPRSTAYGSTPANYPAAGLVGNYCRNPDGTEKAWCFTDAGWDLCAVPCGQ